MNLNKEAILGQLNAIVPNTLLETLKISYTDVGDDFLTAKMPVNSSVHQPQGLLHGGATVALAETVGSTASHLFIDTAKYKIKGLEISANHLKSKSEGEVFATARPIHKGRTTHLWEIRVEDEEGALISLCKLTTIVLAK
ncbi:hotdog fold thioesterase [Kordia sp.]|uniref:hotdog fold thioesterase n=1 Tax=Kordia sp. TaxID=1965332 RepID=UPI0025C4DD9A|nr:hotdog fold thioesterase [Kordia sp.]MCH2193965.1 hotdog fold thioesterase [Kordia sp.]